LKETKKFQESMKAQRELERSFKEQERALDRKYADMEKAQTEASEAKLFASNPKLWTCVKKRLPAGTPLVGTHFSLIDACFASQIRKKK
jgi:glutathione S-transferase